MNFDSDTNVVDVAMRPCGEGRRSVRGEAHPDRAWRGLQIEDRGVRRVSIGNVTWETV